jgi:flagellin
MQLGSINANPTALQALQSLNDAAARLQQTQQRMASGLKVSSAKDNGAAWAIAQTMKGKIAGWQTVDQSLSRGQTVAGVGMAGAQQILDLLHQVQAKLLAYDDPTIDAQSRTAYRIDIQNLVSQIDRTAKGAEFGGMLPLADTLTSTTVSTSTSGYAAPNSPLTPPSLASAVATASGNASQTFTVDGGTNAGRVDVYLDAYSMPDVLEIWQNGQRMAATGQPYAAGGGAVGAGAPVSGQNVLSFDYNPSNGTSLQFQVNANRNAVGSIWTIYGVALQNGASPLPSATSTTGTITVTTSSATNYKFVRAPDGSGATMASKPLTANALGLDAIDWNDPAQQASVVDQAVATADAAATYFGEQQTAFGKMIDQNRALEDQLQTGVGSLVDADLGTESAKLQAGQAQQQLAAKALGIANAAPAWILSLFK